MSKYQKLIKELENNPKNAKFESIKSLLEHFGFTLYSVRGSHYKFKKGAKSVIVPYHKPIKEVYVKQILKCIKE